MIVTLLEKQAIERLPEDSPSFFNVVFLRPKPDGKWRLILDVSRLNKFLLTETFRMDTVQVVRQAVVSHSWGTSVDLSDAYHHIPVHENYRCFLAFQVGDSAYRYTACPFGLSPLPKVFTEVSEVVKKHARLHWGVSVFQYIDDWLFMSQDRMRLAWATKQFVQLCIRLGLIVNMKKSVLGATRQLVHLGMLWDFQEARLRPPDAKIEQICGLAARAAESSHFLSL